jgi:hypothetical protein
MLTSEAIAHFGTMAKLARALDTPRSAVWKWHHEKKGQIPARYAARLHVITGGKLRFDVNEYGAASCYPSGT